MIFKSNKQLDLINTAKKYLDKCEDKKISTTLSSLCYLNNFDISAGYIRLRIFNKQFKLNYLFYLVKNLLLLHRQFDYKIINKNNFYKKKNKLIISWARSRDFNEEGIFIDRYLNLSSKNKKIFFFLIYLEKKLPGKIDKNVILLYQCKKKINFLSCIKSFHYFFLLIKKYKLSLPKIFHEIFSESCFAKVFLDNFKKINIKNVKKVIIAYEAQPYQKNLIEFLKKENKEIKIDGYDNSIDALPINMLYQKNSPDFLYVKKKGHKNIYVNYFFWPKNRVKVFNSISSIDADNEQYKSKIFLAYNISSPKFLLSQFEFYLKFFVKKKIFDLEVRIHPAKSNDPKHQDFKSKLNLLLRKYSNRFSKKSKIHHAFFFGSTGSVLNSLKFNTRLIHFTDNYITDIYNKFLWPEITTKKMHNNIYLYTLKN
jgi:hypothetical protein